MTKQEIIKQKSEELAKMTPAAMAIAAWADATTGSASSRRRDLLRDKRKAVEDFFTHAGKSPQDVTMIDVKTWQAELEGRGLAMSTVYARVSMVSSFYKWILERGPDELRAAIAYNPVDLARPKAPKSYQSESTKALDDAEVVALLAHVKSKASLAGKRDYALLVHYALTGRRSAEVLGLRWGDLNLNGTLQVTYRVKGGEIETRIIEAELVRETMIDYLKASGRLETMTDDTPLWTRHDRAGEPGEPLRSQCFARNLKRYAAEAGLSAFHLHQLRHTFARITGDESGSIGEVQEALGHKSQATTKIYLQRVGVRRDLFSKRIAGRLGLDIEEEVTDH